MTIVSVTGSVTNIQEQFKKNATVSAANSFADTLSHMTQAGLTPSHDTLQDARKIHDRLHDEAVLLEFQAAISGSNITCAKAFDDHFEKAQDALNVVYKAKERLHSLTATISARPASA